MAKSLVWLDYKQHMLGTLQEIYSSQLYTDCRLVVPNGELYANRAMLSMASCFFETIFTSMTTLTMDPSTVLIPDVSFSNLQLVMQFIYTGRVMLQPNEVVPFMEACSLLQLRGVECSGNRTMGIYIDESFPSGNTNSMVVDMDPLELTPETDPLDISAAKQTKPRRDDGPKWNEIFLKDICKGETIISDEESADEESASDADEDSVMERDKNSADDAMLSQDYAKEVEVINPNRSKWEENYTPYVNCLKRAIVEVIGKKLTYGTASNRYNIPQRKLMHWVDKVKRAMAKRPMEMDMGKMIEAIVDLSVQQFKYLLDESDASKQAALLRKSGKTLSYDMRVILAIDEIINHGISLSEACSRYNMHEKLVIKRMYNLNSSKTNQRTNLSMVRKKENPELYQAQVAEALAAMATGTLSVMDASRLFRINRSNLSKLIKKTNIQCLKNQARRATKDANPFSDSALPPLVPIAQPVMPPASSSTIPISEVKAAPKMVCTPATMPSQAVPSLIALPKLVPISSTDQGSDYDQRMQAAIDAITKKQMSYREASLNFHIPKTALWRRLSKMNMDK